MKNTCTYLFTFIMIAFMVVPVFAAPTNATNTTPTPEVQETVVETTVTTEAVPGTTIATVNTTTTTATPTTTESVNATTATTVPVTTVVTSVPATAAAEDTLGEITAASSPLGAALLIDGVYYGTTPVTLNNIPVGNHIVRLTLSGYYDYEGSIYVTPDKVTNVYGTLQPSGSSVTGVATTATTAQPVVTVQPTQTTASGIFDNPTVIAAMIGIITACIGAGATIFTHMKKP